MIDNHEQKNIYREMQKSLLKVTYKALGAHKNIKSESLKFNGWTISPT